jgi:DNA topoisomerase-1
MLMARYLAISEPFTSATQAKRVMSAAVKKVATALGNTAAVCRKSYIHPAISDAYLSGAFALKVVEDSNSSKSAGLWPEEVAVLALLGS